MEELLAERGIEVDHVTIYRWVQRFTPLLADAARPGRHSVGDRWQVDETYVKVAGRWRYVYRAVDQFGQVIDVFVTPQRGAKAARAVLRTGLQHHQGDTSGGQDRPSGNLPGRAGGPAAGGLAPHRAARQQPGRGRYGRLKSRLRPMRGLKQDRSARVIIAGHVFVQNIRRGHYELAVEVPAGQRLTVAFDDLALAI